MLAITRQEHWEAIVKLLDIQLGEFAPVNFR